MINDKYLMTKKFPVQMDGSSKIDKYIKHIIILGTSKYIDQKA